MSHIHIPDGVLPLWLWVAGWIAAIVVVTVAGRIASRSEARRKVPLIGVVAALMIVAMSSEIVPLAYHVNLSVIGGILLAPALSAITAFIVVLVLAMLGHGGVTVLGLNAIVIGAEMVIGWALFHAVLRALGRSRAAIGAGVATVFTLAITTTLVVGIVWLGGAGEAAERETGALDPATMRFENPFAEGVFEFGLFGGKDHGPDDYEDGDEAGRYLSAGRFAAVVYTLGPAGWLIEALVTAGIIGYVARVRPKMVFEGPLAEEHHRIPGDESGGH
ncbi:MAG: energy-coupling factor ABC transporter permease [Coriobacteriia bacterium]|nr:energy-coupling factor ABC transporter permease [Coriobacteriia bacterium]